MDDTTIRSTTGATRERAVAATFLALTDTLVGDDDVAEVLDDLVRTCVDVLDVQAAGMLLLDRRTGALAVAAASSASVRVLEVFQVQHTQGPCPECVTSGTPVVCDDLTTDLRWPGFTAVALQAGFRSVTAVPVRWRGQRVGALGLFGGDPHALPDQDRVLAQAFADAAAIGLTHQQTTQDSDALSQQLRTALDSRIVIEQAKGIVAERAGLGMGPAFEVLRGHARRTNTKLALVAQAVVDGRLLLPR